MITERGPGAPGVTPGMVFTLRPAAQASGERAVDLSAIRRSDAMVELLANRRLMRPHAVHDPVITLLSALATDVDARAATAGDLRGTQVGAMREEGDRAPQPVPADAWVRAATAVAVAATVAGAAATTGVMVTAMLGRLARMSISQPGRIPAGAGRAAARHAVSARIRRTR